MYKKGVVGLLMLLPLGAQAVPYSLFVNGYSDNYTPSVPVLDFFGSWKGAKSYAKADKAYANNFVQMGVKYDRFSFATFYRYDYNLTMDPDVGEYRYLFHNSRDKLENKDYIYDFYEQRIESYGARIGYQFEPRTDLSIASYLNVMTSSKFQDRDITDGYINGQTRLGDAQANYHFSEDTLYQFLTVDEAPKGYGASLDVDISYRVNESLQVNLSVKDLFHFIRWDDSPYARGSFQVDKFIYDDDGVLQQQPLADLMTHEGGARRSFTQHLPTRVKLDVEQYFFEDYLLALEYKTNEIHDSMTIRGGYVPFANSMVAMSYNLDTKAVGVHSRYHQYYLELVTDTVDMGYANSLSLFMGMEFKL